MCGLSAICFSSLHLLGVLNCDPSLTALQNDNKDHYCQDDRDDNNSGQYCDCQLFAGYKLLIKLSQIRWNTRKDVDQKYDRNTVSDTILRDTLADSHKEGTTCRKCADYDRTAYEIVFLEKSLTSESDCERS